MVLRGDMVAARSRMSQPRRIEAAFFRMLNALIEPRVRAGWGSPCLAPGGLVVLETTGRRTGGRSRLPLAAMRLHRYVVVSTFRGHRSEWVKNLVAKPEARYWLGGKPRWARAVVVAPGRKVRGARELPAVLRWLVANLVPYTYAGWAFAVLIPETAPGAPGAGRAGDSRGALRAAAGSRGGPGRRRGDARTPRHSRATSGARSRAGR